jgi:hypothetical protein
MLVDMIFPLAESHHVVNTLGELDSFFFQKADPSWPWKLTWKDMSPDLLV